MEYICAKYKQAEETSDNRAEVSAGSLRKYTYVLPSGRRLKVVVDDDGDLVETASTTPCFLLRMEDELEG